MYKKEIKEEILSKMEININDTLFYMPGETIKGEVKIFPEVKLNVENKKVNLKLKILQYEFWEYNNTEVKELNNINKTEVQINNIDYSLKEEEQSNHKEDINILDFSMIIIEKEEKKEISIPFEVKINDDDKLLPTFQYEDKQYILGIRHLLSIECEEYNSKNYIGLFIGKKMDKNFMEKKEISNDFIYGLNTINIKVIFPKQSFAFNEEIRYQLLNGLNYLFKLDDYYNCELQHNLFRKIEWVGYLKNTQLEKRLINQKKTKESFHKDKDEYFCEGQAFVSLTSGILGGISGSVAGGVYASGFLKLLAIPLGGITSIVIGCIGGAILFTLQPGTTKEYSESSYKIGTKEVKEKENEIKELMKKFVYFNGDKVIGFVKFKEDITPPVNGYYFSCIFNIQIEIKFPDSFINMNRMIKHKIDFYDREKYIKQMKELFSVK